jgi:FtsH-binding integral membrane protein
LGGILSSTLSLLSLAALFQYFTGSSLLFNASIYIGLAMFCGYVLYDTQLIIEKVDKGNLDYPTHAAELFIDFAAIFVRLLVILLQNRERKEKEEKNRSRNR